MISDFAAITCFFSYIKNPFALKRYEEFRKNLDKQGVKLYTVELVAFDDKYVIEDAYLRLRTNTLLWHKESLLNILAKRLPPQIKKIAWLDCDIIIENDDWAKKASSMLDDYKVLEVGDLHTIFLDVEEQEKVVKYTSAYVYHHSIANGSQTEWNSMGRYHPGFGWVAKRDFFTEVGLYEYDIIGGGDGVMMRSFGEASAFDDTKSTWKREQYEKYCPSIIPHLEDYSNKAHAYTRGSMSFIEGNVVHKYHGEHSRRGHSTRMKMLRGIDVDVDLEKSESGLFEWTNNDYNGIFNKFFSVKNDLRRGDLYKYDEFGFVIL